MIEICYGLLVTLVAVLVGISYRRSHMMQQARRSGKISKGKPTMYDVRHLLMKGQKELAVEVYCEIFNTNPIQAKKDVEELERSLKV